jgi:hypothetical protein
MSVLFYCPSGADLRLDVLIPKTKQSSSVYVVEFKALEHKHKEAMHLERVFGGHLHALSAQILRSTFWHSFLSFFLTHVWEILVCVIFPIPIPITSYPSSSFWKVWPLPTTSSRCSRSWGSSCSCFLYTGALRVRRSLMIYHSQIMRSKSFTHMSSFCPSRNVSLPCRSFLHRVDRT